jgi:hypothetical protein
MSLSSSKGLLNQKDSTVLEFTPARINLDINMDLAGIGYFDLKEYYYIFPYLGPLMRMSLPLVTEEQASYIQKIETPEGIKEIKKYYAYFDVGLVFYALYGNNMIEDSGIFGVALSLGAFDRALTFSFGGGIMLNKEFGAKGFWSIMVTSVGITVK